MFIFPGSPAQAQQAPSLDERGYYVRLDVGAGVARDGNVTGSTISGELEDVGHSPIVGAGVGYRFSRHLRIDLTTGYAWGYRLDDDDSTGRNYRADIDAWTTLLNVYFEHPLGDWSPYVTAGAGVSRNTTGTVSRSGLTDVEGDTTTGFAWQVGVGLGYALTPSWTMDFGYRYLDAGEFKSSGRTVTGVTGTPARGDLRSHVALLGLRYSFGGPVTPVTPSPAPASTPAAAPAPKATPPLPEMGPGIRELPVLYRVFFDWNNADISPEAGRVLRNAANTAKAAQAQITRIVATGHADRSGTDRYNMALSLRRANAVKSLLVREGVPENQISVVGKGERETLTPTVDGVREPLNRRVEIIIE